jgi:hypothetical protein
MQRQVGYVVPNGVVPPHGIVKRKGDISHRAVITGSLFKAVFADKEGGDIYQTFYLWIVRDNVAIIPYKAVSEGIAVNYQN